MLFNKFYKKILARYMESGDLVFSPRTDQVMLIISTFPLKSVKGESKKRLMVTWLPMILNSKINCVDVDPDLIFFKMK